MRKTQVWIVVGFCFFALALFAWAQANRKPGLWEMTSSMTWQKSPMPAGMSMPGGGPHTMQVCLTQAMIDKYGAPTPQSRNGDCQVSNVVLKATGMTADWVCSGRMAGKGTVESSWTDPDHAAGKVHFAGAMQMGPNSVPVEYTMEYTSVFKGPDCGSVQPAPMSK
jgi:hypothetical protein